MLDAHSDIAIFPETWWYVVLDRLGCMEEFEHPWQYELFLHEVWNNLKSYRDPAAKVVADEGFRQSRYMGPTVPVLERLGQAYARERKARIWGEKTPGHALWLPQIRALFPRARVLFMVRDPRDVLVSYDDRWDKSRRDTQYLISTAALMKYYLTYLLERPSFPARQVCWVKYEALVEEPRGVMQEVCRFLDVPFQPGMLEFHRQQQNVERDMPEGQHHRLLSRPATADHVGRYRQLFSSSQIALMERLLGAEMQALGYSLTEDGKRVFSKSEERAFQQAEVYYQQMLSGDIRQRFRWRGELKLKTYQILGRTLSLVPSWRVPTMPQHWQARAHQSDDHPANAKTAPDDLLPEALPEGAETATFRSEMGRISRQSGMVFAGTIFTGVFGYFFKVYLARVLGAEALGIYALGMTIVSFLGILNVLGLPQSAVRFVALYGAAGKYDELGSLLWKGSGILLLANLLFAAALLEGGPWFAIHFYHSPALARYFPWFAAIMVLGALNSFFGKVLSGYKEVGLRTLVTSFIASPLSMLVALALIALGGGLWGYLAAQVVSAAAVTALLIWLVWRLTPVAARSLNFTSLKLAPEIWSFSAAMFGVGLMEFFMVQTDRVALGFYQNAHAVGVYAVAAGLVAYESIVLQSVNQIFAPVISDLHTRGAHAVLTRLFQTLTKWMLGLTFPMAIVMMIFARPIMRIFGHDFEAGWPILVIGSCGQLVNCAVGSVGYLLLMSGNQRRLIRVQIAMAAVMVFLCLWLVPLWGVMGAAAASAVTNIGTNVWNLREVRSALKLSPYNWSFAKLLPSVGGAALVTLFLSRTIHARPEWVVIVAAALLAYGTFAVVTVALGLDADDRLVVDAVWARMKGNWRKVPAGLAS
jgi:O-antigen/teichoic acid export membrane protein